GMMLVVIPASTLAMAFVILEVLSMTSTISAHLQPCCNATKAFALGTVVATGKTVTSGVPFNQVVGIIPRNNALSRKTPMACAERIQPDVVNKLPAPTSARKNPAKHIMRIFEKFMGPPLRLEMLSFSRRRPTVR